jgi:hypothetical protein
MPTDPDHHQRKDQSDGYDNAGISLPLPWLTEKYGMFECGRLWLDFRQLASPFSALPFIPDRFTQLFDVRQLLFAEKL